ncbi:hypothetical protein HG530_006783 [Fusarium avenaceum]|nr:hypothetical protein HG530_006783 [Fusarium avenaceum]
MQDNSQYPFPIISEVDRLQKQHTWVNHVLKNKIIFAPVPLNKEGLKILDVGCADGLLLRDIQKQVSSSAQLVGVDIEDSFFPASDDGIRYEVYDLCESPNEGLTEAFDLTHVRYVMAAAGRIGCQKAVENLVVTLAPGGWLQVHELDFSLDGRSDAGPAWKDVNTVLEGMFNAIGMGSDFVSKLPEAFEATGLVNVSSETIHLPTGKLLNDDELAEKSRQAFVLTIPGIIQGAKMFKADIPESTYENLPERFEKEVKEQGAVFRAKIIIGQKPA